MEQIVYKIATLAEYINLIKDEKLESCYFRGENRKYNSITSSLVRDFSPSHDVYGLNTIEVHDQEAIMRELDLVGINRKFIYGDFDSTAQYINLKFYK